VVNIRQGQMSQHQAGQAQKDHCEENRFPFEHWIGFVKRPFRKVPVEDFPERHRKALARKIR
jgi:hypothetical protein